MDQKIQDLLDQAKKIALKNQKGIGTRYPKKLKVIVSSLVNQHSISHDDIVAFVPVSKNSVQRWSEVKTRKTSAGFNKVVVKSEATKILKTKNYIELHLTILAGQVLLLGAQLFLD